MHASRHVLLTVLVSLTFVGCDSRWSGQHKEAGPLPLSSPDKPIVRLVNKRKTFEQGELKQLFWDEGEGPVLAQDRIKPLLDSVPKELADRLNSTRDVSVDLYPPTRGRGGTTYEYVYDTWGVVVSLNPDVLIYSVFEPPVGPHSKLPRSWDGLSIDATRRAFLERRVEFITGGSALNIYAGTLVPWSKEMQVFSTDSKVKSEPLIFKDDRAEVLLSVGKLVFVRHGDDIEVTREY